MGISIPENLGQQESSRLILCTNKASVLVFHTKQKEPCKPSKCTFSCPFQEHLHDHPGCRFQFTVLSPLKLYTLPWEMLLWVPLDLLKGFGTKALPNGCKDGRMRYEHCSFGLFCAFVLNVQNMLSETFLLAQVRVTKLCGLGRWQYWSWF